MWVKILSLLKSGIFENFHIPSMKIDVELFSFYKQNSDAHYRIQASLKYFLAF